jgi:hypothetical protein
MVLVIGLVAVLMVSVSTRVLAGSQSLEGIQQQDEQLLLKLKELLTAGHHEPPPEIEPHH